MRVDTIKLPTGYSLKQVRDHCRELRRHAMYTDSFDRETIANVFGKDVTLELRRKGLIEPARKHHFSRKRGDYYGGIDPGRYRLSNVGHRLTTISLIPPITRAKAKQIVADLVLRAIAINKDPELLFHVTKLTVFGSYLTDKKMLTDVDVDYELEQKIEDYDEFKKIAEARQAKISSSWRIDGYDFVKNEVRKKLRGRVRSLHMSEGQLRKKGFRVRRKQVILESKPTSLNG